MTATLTTTWFICTYVRGRMACSGGPFPTLEIVLISLPGRTWTEGTEMMMYDALGNLGSSLCEIETKVFGLCLQTVTQTI